MPHSYSSKGNRRYRYYVCTNAQQQGWQACPSPSVPAAQMEQFVVDQIRVIGQDAELIERTLAEVEVRTKEQSEAFRQERSSLARQLENAHRELMRLSTAGSSAGKLQRLVHIQESIAATERRLLEIERELRALGNCKLSAADVGAALGSSTPYGPT